MATALVLCSGGIDSVTSAFYAKKILGFSNIELVFFDYGQRNLNPEKKAVKFFSKELNAKLRIVNLKMLKDISQSNLTNNRASKNLSSLKDTSFESEQWYVPCRNLVFLSYTLALSESMFLKNIKSDVFVGFKHEGREFFPDAGPDFLKKMNEISFSASRAKSRIIAPLIKKDKEEIILLAKKLGVRLEKTYSCYVGNKNQCGKCLACRLRKAGFYWANEKDLTKYDD